ncbi:hypothetical protein AAZX31_07G193300, partial [Glycine max]
SFRLNFVIAISFSSMDMALAARHLLQTTVTSWSTLPPWPQLPSWPIFPTIPASLPNILFFPSPPPPPTLPNIPLFPSPPPPSFPPIRFPFSFFPFGTFLSPQNLQSPPTPEVP